MADLVTERAFVEQAIDTCGLAAAKDLILSKAARCFRIHFAGDARSAPPGITRLGGCPDLPKRMTWPRDDEARFGNFFGQLNFSELADKIDAPELPRQGLLSLFTIDIDSASAPVVVKSLFISSGEPLNRAAAPDEEQLADPYVGMTDPVFVRFVPGISLPLYSREFRRAIAASAPDGDLNDFVIALEELQTGDEIGQLLGFAAPYNDTDFYRKLFFHRIGRGGYEYQDYWDSQQEYDAYLARCHETLAASYRERMDPAKLRWLFEHHDEIRAAAARWQLLLRIDSNRSMNFNIADADSIYFFVSTRDLADGDFARMEAGFTQG